MIALAAVCLFSYLVGSIPFGYIAGRIAGVDIRQQGSGNIGATNVLRVLGRKYGYAVFIGDTLKGFVAVRAAFWFGNSGRFSPWQLGIVAAICVVLGHAFPVWLGFRGGKGVATSAGTCLGLFPIGALVAIGIWLLIFGLFRYVSLASVIAAFSLPVTVWFITPRDVHGRAPLLFVSTVLATLVAVRHRSNIRRLLNGTEPRFARR